MVTSLKLPSRPQVKASLDTVHRALESLPRDHAKVVNGVMCGDKPLYKMAEEMGLTEAAVAAMFASALCAVHQAVCGDVEGVVAGRAEWGGVSTFGCGSWPTEMLPQYGSVEAQMAVAQYYRETKRAHEAVPLLVQAAHGEKRASQKADAVEAHWNAAKTFLEFAESSRVSDQDRETFLCSAEQCLQNALAIAQMVYDKRIECELLHEITRVRLGQGDIAMARTYGDLAERAAKGCGSRELQERTYTLFVEWNTCQGMASLANGDVMEAEECAKRAMRLCRKRNLTGQCAAVYRLLDMINEVATRSDRLARERQLERLCDEVDEKRRGAVVPEAEGRESVSDGMSYEMIRRSYVDAEKRRQSCRPPFEQDQI